jgi:hypothetical protein
LTNVAVYPTAISSADWRYNVTAKVTDAPGQVAGFAAVLGYTNPNNYWYVAMGSQNGGIFKVLNGLTAKVTALTTTITPGTNYVLEVRNEGGDIKVYLNGSFLGRTKDVAVPAGGKFGVGTRGDAAVFDDLRVEVKGLPGSTLAPTPKATPTPSTTPQPSPTALPTPSSTPISLPSGGRRIDVSTSAQLSAAMTAARPGDDIVMADGVYTGKAAVGKYTGSFAATTSGTASAPIVLRGSRKAVIDGDGLGGHYGLYAVGARYWRFDGFTVTNATKGFVLDGSSFNTLANLHVFMTGEEGVHFRTKSTDNILTTSDISDTGKKNATYGEGVYVGSANSNWGTYTGGRPDTSDRNQILNNTIARTGAESLDIKEGTTGGVIRGNHIDGAGMTGKFADSWIDMKGNGWTVSQNIAANALLDGFQVHTAIAGWGNNNYFAGNTAAVNGPGWGLGIQKGATGNVWKCDNVVTGAAKGAFSINNVAGACSP